ncbi:MAG: T9SS type A sorting domain-containing protein [Bacteroidales bacterium]|nr:T9SS type A sorting domain-containing protein [Bacteroidales bacterium]
MKKLFTLLMIAFVSLSAFSQVTGYSVGETVDDFTVTDVYGNVHTLYEYTNAGKYVYLDFFYTTCVPCQGVIPIFNEFYDKYGCNQGDIVCICINSGQDNNAAVLAFEETYGGDFNHAVAISNEGGSAAVRTTFGVSYFPTICMIGPDSKLKENDIWPVNNVATFEGVFPSGFSPSPMECTTFADINNSNDNNAAIYPNPTNGVCFISYNYAIDRKYSVSVVNVLGQEVFSNSNQIVGQSGIKLDTDTFDKGIYFVRLLEEGKTVENLKLNVN